MPSATSSSLQPSASIWYRDLQEFITEANASEFFPTQEQPLVTQLNAIMRFAVYFAVILAIIKRDVNASLIVLVVVGAATYIIYEKHSHRESLTNDAMKRLKIEERYRGKKRQPGDHIGGHLKPKVCVPPTKHNPFMNVTMIDRADFPNRPPACSVTHADVKERMEKNYEHDLFRDVGDVFGRRTSSRQFYTMPNTQIPNNQTEFAEWLYKSPPTCKEGNGNQCFRNLMPNPLGSMTGSG